MKRLLYLSFLILGFQFLIAPAVAAVCMIDGVNIPCRPENIGTQPPPGPAPLVFRADIQSTSTDWEAVTGLRLGEYKLTFVNTKPAGNIGWEMYFLDGFPCYGVGQYVRTWVNQRDSTGFIRANCLRVPKEIRLAYREAKKDDYQGKTTGMLTCKVEKNLAVDLSKCEKVDWTKYNKE